MRYHATITSKGQLTVPVQLRDALNLRAGDKVAFVVKANGEVVLEAKPPTFEDLRGIIRYPGADIDAWVEEARSARAADVVASLVDSDKADR